MIKSLVPLHLQGQQYWLQLSAAAYFELQALLPGTGGGIAALPCIPREMLSRMLNILTRHGALAAARLGHPGASFVSAEDLRQILRRPALRQQLEQTVAAAIAAGWAREAAPSGPREAPEEGDLTDLSLSRYLAAATASGLTVADALAMPPGLFLDFSAARGMLPADGSMPDFDDWEG